MDRIVRLLDVKFSPHLMGFKVSLSGLTPKLKRIKAKRVGHHDDSLLDLWHRAAHQALGEIQSIYDSPIATNDLPCADLVRGFINRYLAKIKVSYNHGRFECQVKSVNCGGRYIVATEFGQSACEAISLALTKADFILSKSPDYQRQN